MNIFKMKLVICCAGAMAITAFGVAPASATAFDITGPTENYIDTDPATDVTFNVAETGAISSFGLRIGLDCANGCDGSGSYWDNVQVTISHGGNSAVVFALITDIAGPAGSLDATFHDGFTLLSADDIAQDDLTAGIFGPQDPFSIFNGKELSGDWTLSFIDSLFPFDGTALVSSSIFGTVGEIAGPNGSDVPEPAALGLLGLGLAGAALLRRRQTAGK